VLLTIAVLLAAGCPASALTTEGVDAQKPMVFLTEENPPYNFTDPVTGQVTGFAADKVRAIMQGIRRPYTFQVLPWTVAYGRALTDPDSCVFMTVQTEERRPLFQWVTPLSDGGMALFGLAERGLTLNSLRDLDGYRVMVQKGGPGEAFLRRHVESGGKVTLISREVLTDLGPLQRGEVDFYASGLHDGPYVARSKGIALRLALRLFSIVGGIACHRDFDPLILAQMQEALNQLNASGQSRTIEMAYRSSADWGRGVGE
jgi:polar amino acid transport system substrate-binding protein